MNSAEASPVVLPMRAPVIECPPAVLNAFLGDLRVAMVHPESFAHVKVDSMPIALDVELVLCPRWSARVFELAFASFLSNELRQGSGFMCDGPLRDGCGSPPVGDGVDVEFTYVPFDGMRSRSCSLSMGESAASSAGGRISSVGGRGCASAASSPRFEPSSASVLGVSQFVIRCRVLTALVHPFLDPETHVFQQEAARSLAKACGFRSRCPLDVNTECSAFDVLELALWTLSTVKSRACILSSSDMSDDELAEVWAFHKAGNCAHCPIASMLPASFEVFDSADSGTKARLLHSFRLAVFHKRVEEANEVAAACEHRRAHVARAIAQYQPPAHCVDLFRQHWSEFSDSELLAFLDQRTAATLHSFSHTSLQDPLRASVLNALMVREDTDGVFSFPLFRPEFCQRLADVVKHYEAQADMPKFRPNSMNNFGIIVNEMGLMPLITALCRRWLFSIAHCLLPTFTGGGTLDGHHTFVVEYRPDADISLDMHSDDSEVTFNVNLLEGFVGSSLCFCGHPGKPDHRKHKRSYAHELGRVVVHAGAQRHGALPIVSGERMNLIIWARSSWLRQMGGEGTQRFLHPNEMEPDLVCLSRTHDADYAVQHSKLVDVAGAKDT